MPNDECRMPNAECQMPNDKCQMVKIVQISDARSDAFGIRHLALTSASYSSPIALANTSSSVGMLGRRWRIWVPWVAASMKISR